MGIASLIRSAGSDIESSKRDQPAITLRGVLIGALTVALAIFYVIGIARRQGSGSYIHSQYPMAAFLPFVVWLFVNLR